MRAKNGEECLGILSSEHGFPVTVANSQYLWLPAQDLHNIGPADKIARNEEQAEIIISLSP